MEKNYQTFKDEQTASAEKESQQQEKIQNASSLRTNINSQLNGKTIST